MSHKEVWDIKGEDLFLQSGEAYHLNYLSNSSGCVEALR